MKWQDFWNVYLFFVEDGNYSCSWVNLMCSKMSELFYSLQWWDLSGIVDNVILTVLFFAFAALHTWYYWQWYRECFSLLQLLDLPGIIEGAKDGKGRGKQVIAGISILFRLYVIIKVMRRKSKRDNWNYRFIHLVKNLKIDLNKKICPGLVEIFLQISLNFGLDQLSRTRDFFAIGR